MLITFGKINKAGIIRYQIGADINALAFVRTNLAFNKSGRGGVGLEYKWYDLHSYSELFWSAFSCIRTEYREIWSIGKTRTRITANTETLYAVLEEDKLYKAKDKWHKDRMKRIEFLNKRLHQKIEARAYINNVDEAG